MSKQNVNASLSEVPSMIELKNRGNATKPGIQRLHINYLQTKVKQIKPILTRVIEK